MAEGALKCSENEMVQDFFVEGSFVASGWYFTNYIFFFENFRGLLFKIIFCLVTLKLCKKDTT